MSRQVKRSAQLERSLEKHFLACAAAATAVVTAGSADSAQAAVQYSGLLDFMVNNTTAAGVYLNFDNFTLTTSGAANPGWDVNIFNSNSTTTTRRSVLMYLPSGTTNNAVGQNLPTYAYVSKLGAGVTVDGSSTFPNLPASYPYPILAYRSGAGQYDSSMWNGGVTDGFVGFRFLGADNQTHYGWIRLNVDPFTSATPYKMTVRDFAWETDPNTAIATGAGIPEPAGAIALGVLALGAAGIRPRRK